MDFIADVIICRTIMLPVSVISQNHNSQVTINYMTMCARNAGPSLERQLKGGGQYSYFRVMPD